LITQYYALAVAKAAAGAMGGAPVPGMAAGGQLPGYGGGDKIPIVAERGEYVMPKESTRAYLPILESMRVGAYPSPRGYQEGGVVSKETIIEKESRDKEFNIINVSDPNDAIRALQTTTGENVVLNIIGRNIRAIRRMG